MAEKRLESTQLPILDDLSVLKVLTLNTGTWIQIEMFSGVDTQNQRALRHRAASGPPWIIVNTLAAAGANAIDVGAPAAPSSWYYLYIIADSTGVLPTAGLLSLQLELPYGPGPLLPAGYDLFRRIASVRTDILGQLIEVKKFGQFTLYDEISKNLVWTGIVPVVVTPVSLIGSVPVTAERTLLHVELWNNTGAALGFTDIYSESLGPVPVGPVFTVRATTTFPGTTQVNTVHGWVNTGNNIYIAGTGDASSFANIWVLGYWEDMAPAI